MIKDLRQILYAAYSFVRSSEMNKSASSLTLDDLIQEHLEAISSDSQRQIVDARGNVVGNRISKLDRLAQLKTELQGVIDAVHQAGNNAGALLDIGIDPNPKGEAE